MRNPQFWAVWREPATWLDAASTQYPGLRPRIVGVVSRVGRVYDGAKDLVWASMKQHLAETESLRDAITQPASPSEGDVMNVLERAEAIFVNFV